MPARTAAWAAVSPSPVASNADRIRRASPGTALPLRPATNLWTTRPPGDYESCCCQLTSTTFVVARRTEGVGWGRRARRGHGVRTPPARGLDSPAMGLLD